MTARIRVLYADDEPDLLEIGKLFLEQSGDFIVTTALSASIALRLLEHEQFDVIISDYQMPEMDGIQFLVEVRTRLGPLPFILFTGRGREEVVIQAINSGADFYLQKGGDPSAQFAELVHKIKQAALRNKAENLLLKSEEKYRYLIEHSNEAIVVAQDGMLKLVNHKMIEFTGYSEQELLSMQFSAFIHPKDRPMVVDRYQKRMKGEEPPSRYAFRLISKDGSTWWIELSVAAIDWDGRPATLNFLTDINERKRADDSLREEQQFSKLILDSLPGIFYLYTYPENRMVRWNKQHETLLGYTAEEIKGKLGTDLHLPEYKDAVLKAIDEVMEKGQSSVESTLLAKDGRLIPFYFTGVRFESPGRLYFMGIGIDISERKVAEETLLKKTAELHASYEQLTASEEELHQNVDDLAKSERALRESEKRYRLIDDASLDYIYSYDLGGHFASANRSLCTAMMLRSDQILGRTHDELGFPDTQCRDWDDLHRKVYDTGTTVTSLTSTPMPDGSIRHYEVVLNPLHDSEGMITGIAGTTRDITDRKHAEEALQESEGLLKTVVANLHGIVFSVDKDGIFLLSEGRSLSSLGLKPGQVVGLSVFDVYKDVPEIIAGMKTALSGKTWSGISRVQDIFFDTFVAPIFDSSQKVAGAVGIATNITERKRAELELVSAYESLKDAHRLAHIGTWDWVIETDTVTWSEELCNIAGWDPSLPAPTYAELPRIYTPSSWDLLSNAVTKALTTGEPYNLELEMIRPDGSIRWTNAFGGVQRDGNGKIIGFHGTVQDITERKEVKEANQKRDLQIRNLFENIPLGMFQVTPEGKFVFVNTAIATMLGYDSPEDLVETVNKTSIADALYEHPEKRPAFVREVQQNRGMWKIFENRYRKKDGTIIDTILSFSLYTDPITGLENQYGFIQDITERKVDQDALQESESRFRTIFDSTFEFMALLRPDGSIVGVNETALMFGGFSLRDVVNKPFWEIRWWNIASEIQDRLKYAVASAVAGEFVRYEVEILGKDDRVITIDFSLKPVLDISGTVKSLIAEGRDITERKQSEKVLQESEERLRSILASIDDLVFTLDENNIFVGSYNPVISNLYVLPEEFMGKSLCEVLPKELAHQLQKIIEEVKGSGKTQQVEYCLPVQGKIAWFNAKLSARYSLNGTCTGVTCVARDVTERKRAEEALLASEQRFHSMFERHDSVMLLIDPETGDIIDANRAAERFYGRSHEALCQQTIQEVNTLSPGEVSAEMQKAIHEKNNFFIFPHRLANGEIRTVEVHSSPIDMGGKTVLFSIVTDITERKQADAALLATLKRIQEQQAALASISFSPALLSGDLDEFSTRLTEESAGVLGVERASVWIFDKMGDELRCIDLFLASHNRHSRDLVLKRHEYVNEFDALSTAKFIDASDPLTDSRTAGYVEGYLKPNHITSMLDAVIRVSGQNLGVLCFEHVDRQHQWENDEVAFACQLADQIAITLLNRDRKRAEETLRDSEEKYRALFAAESDGIFIVDKETGTIIDCNDAITLMYGYRRDEAIGQPNTVMSAEPDATHAATQEVRGLIPIRYHKRKDGSVFPVEITASIVSVKGRDMIVAAVRDITDRKQAEDALALASKKLNLLSSITRHDINNQLTVQMGYLGILEKKEPDTTHNEYFQKVSTAAKRISAMIQFTKEYEEIGVHAPVWQDTRTLVETAIKQAPLGKVIVKNDLPHGAEVLADPLVVKVFYNLMDNAVRYGGKITTIRFSVDELDGDHVVVCEDDGDGIVTEEKEKIFERGFGKNTELGLALSREILSITGITITETGEPGQGARFEMLVPKEALK